MIELLNITKEFKNGSGVVKALNDINVHINQGELVVILGPSGSGKSTFLNVTSGLEPATRGVIIYNGDIHLENMNDRELTQFRKNHVGFIFQQYYLIPTLTVYNNIKMGTNLSKVKVNPKEIIELVELVGKENRLPFELSGGEQQRVAIARALGKRPAALFCDEPTGALDTKTGKQILKCLINVNKAFKTTVMIVTHNEEIAKIAHRVLKMKDGYIVSDMKQIPIDMQEIQW